LAAGGGAWLRGGQDVAFEAGDNSGIRRGRVELDGGVVYDGERSCDYTRPVPCSDGAVSASFDTRTWPDGEHRLRLSAQDAGGNWASVDRIARVDNTAPVEPAPELDGGAGWSPRRVRSLALPLPGGQAAPLTRARVRACRVGGACEESAPELRVAPGGGATASGAAGEAASSAPAGRAGSPGRLRRRERRDLVGPAKRCRFVQRGTARGVRRTGRVLRSRRARGHGRQRRPVRGAGDDALR
jgi:hypothetical protein